MTNTNTKTGFSLNVQRSGKVRKLVCSTYLPPDVKEKFYEKCDENGFTPAEQLRRFVYEYINKE